MSAAGGVHKALERGSALGCEAVQLFVRPNTRWKEPPLKEGEEEAFREEAGKGQIRATMAHGCYLVNLASPDRKLRSRSIGVTAGELRRCALLGIPLLAIHPGSHMGRGRAKGIRRVVGSLDRIRESTGDLGVALLLETTAGQGTTLGATFEELRDILGGVRDPDWLGVCLDTCHLFASGWDLRAKNGYLEMREALQEAVGLERVRAVHVNDSRGECGSRRDRHAHIGEGKIGLEGFRNFLKERAFGGLPFVIETPKEGGDTADRKNLARLRSLLV
jgi:deoxyribonuclease-4